MKHFLLVAVCLGDFLKVDRTVDAQHVEPSGIDRVE